MAQLRQKKYIHASSAYWESYNWAITIVNIFLNFFYEKLLIFYLSIVYSSDLFQTSSFCWSYIFLFACEEYCDIIACEIL